MSYSLKHHGILGQKWGIRRYQNKDGTYTSEGKRRRKEDNYSYDENRKRELQRKPSSQLSNKELRELNERYNLEQQRNRYENNGKHFINNLGSTFSNQIVTAIAVTTVAAGTAYVKNKLKS